MTADSSTDPDPITGVCDDKSVDSKELLDPIAFVAVKAEVTVSYSLFFPPLHFSTPVSYLLFSFQIFVCILLSTNTNMYI
jgi:hypothetical protein